MTRNLAMTIEMPAIAKSASEFEFDDRRIADIRTILDLGASSKGAADL